MTSLALKQMRALHFERQPVLFNDIADAESVGRIDIALSNLATLEGVHRLSNLEEIHIGYCRSLKDLSPLEGLRGLRRIGLLCLPNIEIQFQPKKLKRLEFLSYNNVATLTSLHGIETLQNLNHLGLSRVKVLDGDYMPIVKCKSLSRVFRHGSPFKAPAMKEIRRLRPDILIGGNCARPTVQPPKK